MLPTSSQKGLSRVGHERPLNTTSCADQPTNKRREREKCYPVTTVCGMAMHVAHLFIWYQCS